MHKYWGICANQLVRLHAGIIELVVFILVAKNTWNNYFNIWKIKYIISYFLLFSLYRGQL